MKFREIVFFVAIALTSCEVNEDQNPLIPSSNDLIGKLREVVSMPIGSPSGKLDKVITFSGDSDIVFLEGF